MALNNQHRVMTRHWKNKVLQDESQLNCMTSEVKEQILELSKSSEKRNLTPVEESSLQKPNLESKDKMENIEWIMCDDCLKWRKISCEDVEEFHGSRKWFCSLNNNFAFNQCFAPEECYSDLIKMIRQKDLAVVILGLQLGDLVWAKMVSFYRWPSLISCDPISGEFISGQPGYDTMYHVEFLGPKHSHIWIKGCSIELYSEAAALNLLSEKTTMKKKIKIHRNLKLYNQLQNAIKEANTLVDVANSKRMECCVFENADGTARVTQPLAEYRYRNHREFPINQSKNRTWYKNDSAIAQHCSKPNRCVLENSPGSTQNFSEATESFVMSCYNNNTEVKHSLLTLTSQQRLHFDIQVYKKSEIAFTVDLKQFLARNNLDLETTYWENVPVNSYQLFQAVNEFGGYEKVSKKSKWSNIYQEITHTHEKYKGTLARKFYYRNLYAYSLYILGKNYECVIQDILRQEKKKDKSFVLEKPRKRPKMTQKDPEDDFFCTLYEQFEELENANKMCYFEEEIKSAEKELGISIRFHDEPTPVSSLLEYTFPLKDSAISDNCQELTTEGFQVPDIFTFDAHSANNDLSQTESDNESLNLEDLNVLKEQIELVSCQINL